MKVNLSDNAIGLIMYCLEQQAYEFNAQEQSDYNSILTSFQIAAEFEYDCDF